MLPVGVQAPSHWRRTHVSEGLCHLLGILKFIGKIMPIAAEQVKEQSGLCAGVEGLVVQCTAQLAR